MQLKSLTYFKRKQNYANIDSRNAYFLIKLHVSCVSHMFDLDTFETGNILLCN